MNRLKSIIVGSALLLAGMGQALAGEVAVFAAASTTNAIEEIGAKFKARTGHVIKPSFAASSTLAKQVENDAPGQVFISADQKWADYLDQRKLLEPGTRMDLLGNRLALVASAEAKDTLVPTKGFPLAAALKDGRLAVGDPAHVPAGRYAEEALKALGVWTQLEPKLARADTVRAALAFVERGEAPYGIIYTTDAAVTPKVRIVGLFPEDSHTPITYPVALIKGKATPEAKAFYDYLQSEEAKDVFRKFGFAVK